MEIVVNLDHVKAVLLCILIIAIIALVIYSLFAIFNLIKTLKKTQTVLDDFEVVSKVASERTKELDKFIEETQKKIKSGQNIFNAVPVIITAITQIAKVVGQNQKKKA